MIPEQIKPWPITDAEIAFGQINKNAPDYDDLLELKEQGKVPARYEQLATEWFFHGVTEIKAAPREGINSDEAIRCIQAELHSWGRKHQHKTLLIAWLFDQWFEAVEWKKAEKQDV